MTLHSVLKPSQFIQQVAILNPDEIITETISYYRTNILFNSFAIKSQSDNVLVYLTVFLNHLIKNLQEDRQQSQQKYERILAPQYSQQINHAKILQIKPQSIESSSQLDKYLQELREKMVQRVVSMFFEGDQVSPEIKFWKGLSKNRLFIGIDYK